MAVYLGNIEIGNGNYLGNINFNQNSIFMPPTLYSVDYLIVAGGASGGSSVNLGAGGGIGGSGGYISGSTILTPSTYAITVGIGGAASTGQGNNGQNSEFFSLTSIGGGGGGNAGGGTGIGSSGGSGGGGAGGGIAGGSGTAGQGFAGGTGAGGATGAGGGGGGASSAASGTTNGNGKLWLDGNTYSPGTYGSGGGTNRGGGASIAGQDGVVIVRYSSDLPTLSGGTITQSGGFTYHTFTSAGNLVVT